MIKLATAIAMTIVLTGCAPIKTVAPVNHYVEIPVPFCPIPDDVTLPKQGGIEFITQSTPPGDVAKHWAYEGQYWKNQAELYKKQLDNYKQNGIEVDKKAQELRDLIKSAPQK